MDIKKEKTLRDIIKECEEKHKELIRTGADSNTLIMSANYIKSLKLSL